MQPVTVRCRAPEGLNSPEVSVEVFLGRGLPGLAIVGLVETAVKESRDRVRAAIQSSGMEMPDRRIVVSLAPAHLPKSGSRYDLAIALGILGASGQVPSAQFDQFEFAGELALSGELRSVPGALPVAMAAIKAGRRVIVPAACALEVGLINDPAVLIAETLLEVCAFLRGDNTLPSPTATPQETVSGLPDLDEVIGQNRARRALEIAATGGHNLLMTGPPGTGKSMLAQRLPGILPPCSNDEALATAALYSLRGVPATHWPAWGTRPFRAPHHTATAAALAGGGGIPTPGEISLAHNGVLFLDELPEYPRAALEILREPLESGSISIARAQRSSVFPARVQLIAAMNPCPCGFLGDQQRECRCTPQQIHRYIERLSGPLMERIDLRVQLERERVQLSGKYTPGESSQQVRDRVCSARKRATLRSGLCNAQLDNAATRRYCWPNSDGLKLLDIASERFSLSRRSCNRVLRVARSIADLDESNEIRQQHLAEALSFRPDDGALTPA